MLDDHRYGGGLTLDHLEAEVRAHLREHKAKNEKRRSQKLRLARAFRIPHLRGYPAARGSSLRERMNWKNSRPSRNRRCITCAS